MSRAKGARAAGGASSGTIPDYDVIIVGAGLAGLSCAHELIVPGLRMLLLEAKPFVGGRTSSWSDSDGMRLESGLHRVPGFYSAFPELLRRAGLPLDRCVIWEDEVEFRQAAPAPSALFSASLTHRLFRTLGGLFTENDYLPPLAKASAAKLVAVGLKDYAARPGELDAETIVDYARRHETRPEVVEHVLRPIVSGFYFVPPERFSAYAFFGMIAPYLPTMQKLAVGAFNGGMTEVMAQPLAEVFCRQGGEVRVGAPVRELVWQNGRVSGVVTANEVIRAHHVVLATSVSVAQHLLRAHWAEDAWCRPMLGLRTMPAATLQLELDAPSMDVDHTTFGVGSSLACFTEQSRTTFRELPGRLSIILAPSDRFIEMEPEAVLAHALDEADRLQLRVRGHVKRWRTVNHPADFYALSPGQEGLRPEQATPIPGLTLAGDYTRQTYLATMEGAVVSGQLAARHVAASLGRQ